LGDAVGVDEGRDLTVVVGMHYKFSVDVEDSDGQILIDAEIALQFLHDFIAVPYSENRLWLALQYGV
jgi:hypothetical protein